MSPPQQLVLIRGLPGSGKSTLAREMARAIVADHCEADDFFMRDGTYAFDRARLDQAHAHCLLRARLALEAGRSCVVANTFIRRWEMAPYHHLAAEAGIKAMEIVTRLACVNIHGVPTDVIERMRARWED